MLERLVPKKTVAKSKESRVILDGLVNEMSTCMELTESKLAMVLIVQDVYKGLVNWAGTHQDFHKVHS